MIDGIIFGMFSNWAEQQSEAVYPPLLQEAPTRALMLSSMWQTSHEAVLINCVCVRVCVSTHLMEKMAPCFSYLHGCRIIEALQERQSGNR